MVGRVYPQDGFALEESLLVRAVEIHDRSCNCDRKYRRSCPRFADAILRAGKEFREEGSA